MEKDIDFLLRRASEEILKAIGSDQPEATEAHEELSMRYSLKAVSALADADEPKADTSGGATDHQRIEPGAAQNDGRSLDMSVTDTR